MTQPRTVRNLVHSARSACANPSRPALAGERYGAIAVMTTPPAGLRTCHAVELHRVPRQFHVGLLQGRPVGAHLAERDPVGGEGRHHSFG